MSADQLKAMTVAIRESALAVLRVKFPRGDEQELLALATEISRNAAQTALFAIEEL